MDIDVEIQAIYIDDLAARKIGRPLASGNPDQVAAGRDGVESENRPNSHEILLALKPITPSDAFRQ